MFIGSDAPYDPAVDLYTHDVFSFYVTDAPSGPSTGQFSQVHRLETPIKAPWLDTTGR